MIYRFIAVFYCLFALSFASTLNAQSLKRANRHFKNGNYAKAIPIYKQLIEKEQNVAAATAKLAESLRKINKIEEAAPIFAKIATDSTARPTDWAHYGEVLLMLGKYDSAAIFLQKSLDAQPEQPKTALLLASAKAAPTIKSMLEVETVETFAHNSDGDDNAPIFLGDDLIFSSDRHPGGWFPAKNEGTGRYFFNVFAAKFTEKDSIWTANFTPPSKFSNRIAETGRNTSNASFTKSGGSIFYCQNDVNDSKSSNYNLQIFQSRKSKNGWGRTKKLSFCSSESNYLHPTVSPDGNTLFFVAERGGGMGGTDIWMSKKQSNGKWTKPENLGEKVNTPANEGFPFVAADGKLYFCSRGHAGMGGYDIFVTQQYDNGEWAAPQNLGAPFNSPHDDLSFSIHKSGFRGAFASSRGGRGDDIFLFSLKNNLITQVNEEGQPVEVKPKKTTKSKKNTKKNTKKRKK